MTTRTFASGRFGLEVQLELHRPQCTAFQAALSCITASREAAALIAGHLPPEDWPGEDEEDRRRIWKILAGRGLPTASAADLRVFRGFLRDLRATSEGADQTTTPTPFDEVMVIDEEDDEPTDRVGGRRSEVPGRSLDNASNRRHTREPRRLSVEPPGELIEVMQTALDHIRLYRDTRHAMRLAGIGGESLGTINGQSLD